MNVYDDETLIKISVIDPKKCGISEGKIITAKINNSDNSLSKEKKYIQIYRLQVTDLTYRYRRKISYTDESYKQIKRQIHEKITM